MNYVSTQPNFTAEFMVPLGKAASFCEEYNKKFTTKGYFINNTFRVKFDSSEELRAFTELANSFAN
jgi:hypothetical protein